MHFFEGKYKQKAERNVSFQPLSATGDGNAIVDERIQ
jgi:hypothetical protein